MRKGFVIFIDGVKTYGSKIVESGTTFAILLSIGAMFVASAVLIAFTTTQISATLETNPIPAFKNLTDWLMAWVGVIPDELDPSQYSAVLASSIGTVAVLVTLWFSVTTTVTFVRHRIALNKRSLIQEHKIYRESKDDLDVMYRYYRKADWIVVFSGDFSWLNQDHSLCDEVQRLVSERKITLVSYKSRDAVEHAIGKDKLAALEACFHFDVSKKLKCSLIHVGMRTVLMYLADTSADFDGRKQVCVVSDRDNAYNLLETITRLCSQYIPD